MVRIASPKNVEVQIEPSTIGERLEEVRDQGERELWRDPRALQLSGDLQVKPAPPREVDDRTGEGFIEGSMGGAETCHTLARSQRSCKSLPEDDSGVFNRVMQIDVGISANRQIDSETGVPRQSVDHV